MRKKGNWDNGVISHLLGFGVAVCSSLLLIGVTSKMLLEQKMGEGSVELIVSVILMLSTFTGSFISGQLKGKNSVSVSAITALLIAVIIILSGLMVDGKFQNVLLRIGSVFAGGVLSCILCLKNSAKTVRRKSGYR